MFHADYFAGIFADCFADSREINCCTFLERESADF